MGLKDLKEKFLKVREEKGKEKPKQRIEDIKNQYIHPKTFNSDKPFKKMSIFEFYSALNKMTKEQMIEAISADEFSSDQIYTFTMMERRNMIKSVSEFEKIYSKNPHNAELFKDKICLEFVKAIENKDEKTAKGMINAFIDIENAERKDKPLNDQTLNNPASEENKKDFQNMSLEEFWQFVKNNKHYVDFEMDLEDRPNLTIEQLTILSARTRVVKMVNDEKSPFGKDISSFLPEELAKKEKRLNNLSKDLINSLIADDYEIASIKIKEIRNLKDPFSLNNEDESIDELEENLKIMMGADDQSREKYSEKRNNLYNKNRINIDREKSEILAERFLKKHPDVLSQPRPFTKVLVGCLIKNELDMLLLKLKGLEKDAFESALSLRDTRKNNFNFNPNYEQDIENINPIDALKSEILLMYQAINEKEKTLNKLSKKDSLEMEKKLSSEKDLLNHLSKKVSSLEEIRNSINIVNNTFDTICTNKAKRSELSSALSNYSIKNLGKYGEFSKYLNFLEEYDHDVSLYKFFDSEYKKDPEEFKKELDICNFNEFMNFMVKEFDKNSEFGNILKTYGKIYQKDIENIYKSKEEMLKKESPTVQQVLCLVIDSKRPDFEERFYNARDVYKKDLDLKKNATEKA